MMTAAKNILGRQRKIPLYMCFVDLQKAYDSVDRELLWKVLARAGVPSAMIDVIRQRAWTMGSSLNGLRSHRDSGKSVCCHHSALLFNIFFAAVIEVVLQRFSEYTTPFSRT